MADQRTRRRLCIVSGGDEVRFRSYVNHRIFALEHGYDHRLEIALAPGITIPYYYKLQAIENVLPTADWTLWVDDDVYFTDWASRGLDDLMDAAEAADCFCVIAEGAPELSGAVSSINSGVMLLRDDPRSREFLTTAREADLAAVRAWWDDDAYGMFTHGDQDTLWWALATRPHLRAGATIAGFRQLNARAHHYDGSLSDAFAVHFCGGGDKALRMGEFARRFGLGRELVPSHLLERYSVRRREQMTPAELTLRQARHEASELGRRVRAKVRWVRETGRWR